MAESAGDGTKRKSEAKLSGASRRKFAKEASLKEVAAKCVKLTSFITKQQPELTTAQLLNKCLTWTLNTLSRLSTHTQSL